MKKILTLVMLSLIAISSFAIPAKPRIIKHTQSDGTTIEYRLRGDEFHKFRTTTDNYLIKLNENGDYEYATLQGSAIRSTGVKVNNVKARTQAELDVIASLDSYATLSAKMSKIHKAKRNVMQRSLVSSSEVKRGLVILVNFKDVKFKSATANSDFTDMLNKEGYSANGATGSAVDYFKSCSNGKYTPSFDVYGPITLNNNMSYYGGNDYNGDDKEPAQMVLDAMTKLMADDNQDIDLANYDTDGNGTLDNIFVFYAGHNEAEGAAENTVWPHAWEVSYSNSTGNRVFDGKTLSGYACTSELRGASGSTMSGIGTFCHEFTHVLGFPDVYATDYAEHKTSGDWDIMDSGGYLNDGNTPPSYSAYERFFMGWLTPTILNKGGKYTLDNIIDSNSAFLISETGEHNLDGVDPNPKDFFLLENRKLEGWDKYLPGAGMIVTRIRFDESSWYDNTLNNTKWNMGIDIIEADGKASDYDEDDYTYAYYGKAGDAFPGTNKVSHYEPYDEYPLTDIQLKNSVISFDFMGGEAIYTVNFSTAEYGTCNVTSLKEASEGAGVELPAVTANGDNITFEGWATSASSKEANAGDAGDMFYPTTNTTLYAIFSVDGEITGGNNGSKECFIETFDGTDGTNSSVDIATKLDDFTDNEGWTGEKAFPFNKAIKLGSNKYKGELTTPALQFVGDVEMTIRVYGKSSTTLKVVSNDGIVNEEINISSSYEDYTVELNGLQENSKLTFSTGKTIFYIDNLEICPVENITTNNDNTVSTNVALLGSDLLVGLEAGDNIRCYDLMGRLQWSETAISNTMNFTAPRGVFIISIEREGNTEVIKGIGE